MRKLAALVLIGILGMTGSAWGQYTTTNIKPYLNFAETAALGATPVINWATCHKRLCTMTATVTSCTFTAPTAKGDNLLLILKQGGTGSYTFAWPATIMWSGGTAPTLSTAVGAVDVISLVYIGNTTALGATKLYIGSVVTDLQLAP